MTMVIASIIAIILSPLKRQLWTNEDNRDPPCTTIDEPAPRIRGRGGQLCFVVKFGRRRTY